MPAPQINLRLRDGLDTQLRELAATESAAGGRVEPRDLVERALIDTYGFKRSAAAPAGQPELPLTTSPPPAAESHAGCPECGGEMDTTDDPCYMTCTDCKFRREL